MRADLPPPPQFPKAIQTRTMTVSLMQVRGNKGTATMLLKSQDGAVFELRVLRYAYPRGRWLEIYTRATTERGFWEVTDPSLDVPEVGRLSKWLSAHSASRMKRNEVEFKEPNLSFAIVHNAGDVLTLRVYFELESRPPWAYSTSAGQRDLWIDLRVSPEDLMSAAEALTAELKNARHRREIMP